MVYVADEACKRRKQLRLGVPRGPLMLPGCVLMLVVRHLHFQRFVALLLNRTVWRLALERPPGQLRFGQNRAGLQLPRDAAVALERALHLLPADELVHLFGQLPELLEVDVSVGEPSDDGRVNMVLWQNRGAVQSARTDWSSPRSESTGPSPAD